MVLNKKPENFQKGSKVFGVIQKDMILKRQFASFN